MLQKPLDLARINTFLQQYKIKNKLQRYYNITCLWAVDALYKKNDGLLTLKVT